MGREKTPNQVKKLNKSSLGNTNTLPILFWVKDTVAKYIKAQRLTDLKKDMLSK